MPKVVWEINVWVISPLQGLENFGPPNPGRRYALPRAIAYRPVGAWKPLLLPQRGILRKPRATLCEWFPKKKSQDLKGLNPTPVCTCFGVWVVFTKAEPDG